MGKGTVGCVPAEVPPLPQLSVGARCCISIVFASVTAFVLGLFAPRKGPDSHSIFQESKVTVGQFHVLMTRV